MRPAEQHPLDLGPRDHFQLLHGSHADFVAVASRNDRWTEHALEHDQAALTVEVLLDSLDDVYLSQSGFSQPRRCAANAASVSVLFADLDYYKIPALASLTPHQIWAEVHKALPWLPRPTLLADSGRGAYLVWSLAKRDGGALTAAPIGPADFGKWVSAMKRLTVALADFGADQAVVDLARVLRVPGSYNRAAERRVSFWTIGNPVQFSLLDRVLRRHVDEHRPTPATPTAPARIAPSTAVMAAPACLYQFRPSWHQTNYYRLMDLHRLAKHRAPVKDCRDRLLFCLAVCLSYISTDRQSIERDLLAFAAEHFEPSPKYTDEKILQRMRPVLERFDQGAAGQTIEFNGRQVNARYRMRDATILRWLELTPSEAAQAGLVTLLDPETKAERKRLKDAERITRKRREAGVVERQEYLELCEQQTETQAQLARRLLWQGMTKAEVAEQLGVKPRRLRYILATG